MSAVTIQAWTGLEADFDPIALMEALRSAPPVDVADDWPAVEALAMVRETGYLGLDADRLLHRGWPLEAVDWRLASFPATTTERQRALDLARQLAAGDGAFEDATGRAGLGLVGAPGRGKTGLACAIGAALDAAGRDVRFVRWGDVLGDAFAALGARRSGTRLEDVLRPLAHVDVLILDDLGDADGGAPDFARRVLREIVWPRYERRATTIVTTNLAEAAMIDQFGEAAVSRLYGLLRWHVLDGADERRVR